MIYHLVNVQYQTGLASGRHKTAFLLFGGTGRANWYSNCPFVKVATYKNLIYLLNLQIYVQ